MRQWPTRPIPTPAPPRRPLPERQTAAFSVQGQRRRWSLWAGAADRRSVAVPRIPIRRQTEVPRLGIDPQGLPSGGARGAGSTSLENTIAALPPGREMFLSVLPHGERPAHRCGWIARRRFLSALPHGERRPGAVERFRDGMFLSALPHGERRIDDRKTWLKKWFLSALPHGEGRVPPSGVAR